MDFILYLHQNGHIGAETAMRVLHAWTARRPRLGSLAVKHGVLTVRDVMQIVATQASADPRQLFGRTAVAMGMLSDDMLEMLLEEQDRAQPPTHEIFEELTGREAAPLLAQWRGGVAA